MVLQDAVSNESKKNDEDDLQSIKWRKFAEDKIKRVIAEIVQYEDEPLEKLVEAASTILESSSHIILLKNHKGDFGRLLCDASSLVVVLWQSYKESIAKYPSLDWPPPKIREFVDELVEMVHRIHGLIKRKSNNFAKRILLSFFGIRDLGKLKKYQRRLDAVAAGLKRKPHNMNILGLLREAVNSPPPQPHYADTALSEDSAEGDSPIKKGSKKGAFIQEPTAEGSRFCEVEKSTTAKPPNQNVESEDVEEDNQRESKAVEKGEAKVNLSNSSSRSKQVKQWGTQGTMKIRHTKFDEEVLESEEERNATRFKESDEEDVEEGTSGQGSWTKSKTRKKLTQAYDDEDNNVDTPVGDPIVAWGPSKKKHATTPKRRVRSQTTQVSSQPSISFSNGPGIMINDNSGNVFNSTTSNVHNGWVTSRSF